MVQEIMIPAPVPQSEWFGGCYESTLEVSLRTTKIYGLSVAMFLGVSLSAGSLLAADRPPSAKSGAKASVEPSTRRTTFIGVTNVSKKARLSKHKTSSRNAHGKRVRGQANIDWQRTHQIQSALIREHYLSGSPSGAWDDATQKAMKRYQADHGWQSKTTPDARALIKLGLGPDQGHLLNPESAMTMTSQPVSPRSNSIGTSAVSDNPASESRSK